MWRVGWSVPNAAAAVPTYVWRSCCVKILTCVCVCVSVHDGSEAGLD